LPNQYENNIGNINSLVFYHEIRWNLEFTDERSERFSQAK